MLAVHPETGDPVWVDLCEASDEEIKEASTRFGVHIPTRASLEEIESSSRLQYRDNIFTLSVPVSPARKDVDEEATHSPLGFILTPKLLVTVRFAHLRVFGPIIQNLSGNETPSTLFMTIIEAMVDYGADRLETIKADTLTISKRIFRTYGRRHMTIARANKMLRATLVQVGDLEEQLSDIRDTLLSLQRIAPFVVDKGHTCVSEDVLARLKTTASDIQSLSDYETHLTDKVQFLLDATLGFLGAEQNDLFKVLTIVSVVGIPPVLIAGIYGMNFKVMPELSWVYGYPYSLALMAISAIIPVAWFKWRGWW